MLKIDHIRKNFGDLTVLDDITVNVNVGEVVVFLGPSGCGKTTLLRCINGLETIQAGQIVLHDEVISGDKTKWSDVRQKVGMVFQSYDLFPHKNVLGNVTMGPIKVQGVSKADAIKEATALLERVGLPDKIYAYPRQLSGGQKQRVAIVRALMMHPEVLLLDEITAALDPEMVREVLDVVLELANDGMTMLIVTHEMEFAQKVSNRVVFMDKGNIIETGSPDDFFTNPSTPRARQFLDMFHY
ncbi:MAG: amino acid ABC transporter ATP-binding protein [Clostridiales Family XIII bacterium]|nr:amino acid ABC transporter ATP-binding protein [Clostridiales Family XIII bacterium]